MSYLEAIGSFFNWKPSKSITLRVFEPLSDKQSAQANMELVPWQPLCKYVPKWHGYALVIVNSSKQLTDAAAALYVPSPGDVIDLYPDVGVKSFTNAYIERLNETSGAGGRFLKAVIVTESVSPLVKRYFVDDENQITFDGNTFTPLNMIWSGFEVSSGMNLATMTVTVNNLGGEVIEYIEKFDILENDAELLVLHTDLLTDVNSVDRLLLQIQQIQADDNAAAFTLGLNLGLTDLLPRRVFTKAEFPGLIDDISRLAA